MLGIVLVNYRALDPTVAYFENELRKIALPFKLAVVNNAADAELDEALVNRLNAQLVTRGVTAIDPGRDVFVISEAENHGYARGNNIGAEFLISNFGVEWILVTNNDLELRDVDVVSHLVETGTKNSSIGIVGPRVVSPTGQAQSPHRRVSIYSQIVFPGLAFPLIYVLRKLGLREEIVEHATEGEQYRVMGSFMLVRTAAFRVAGGFDPATFLYGEELILSARMRRHNYITYFTPHRSVVHQHSSTISSFHSIQETTKMQLESLLYFYREYEGVNQLTIGLARFASAVFRSCYLPIISLKRSYVPLK